MPVPSRLALLMISLFVSPALAAADETKFFDPPLEVRVLSLPGEEPAREDFQPRVTCSYYTGFMVKEEDLGELGASRHAILRYSGTRPACERESPDETVVKDWWGYFLGAKGPFIIIDAADSFSTSLPFGVLSADTIDGKPLMIDARILFEDVAISNGELTLRYERSLLPDCSLLTDAECWPNLRALTDLADEKRPDCTESYKRLEPDQTETPSIISYPAEMRIVSGKVTIRPRPGSVTCWPQS